MLLLVGEIKVFGLEQGVEKAREVVKRTSVYLADVKVRGNTVMAVDWYGEIQEWTDEDERLTFVKEFEPNFEGSENEEELSQQQRFEGENKY